jgi:hypothetical protein
LKASDHLDRLVKPGGEFAARAQPWRMILSGGLATGYMELADAAEAGGRASQSPLSRFMSRVNAYRKQANGEAVNFAEAFMAFVKSNPEAGVPISFSFPSGSTAPVPELNKLSNGGVLSDTEMAGTERRVLNRSVVQTACSAVGAQDDFAKAQQVFAGQNPTVPKDTFLLAMAAKLHELSKLYSPTKADQPERRKLFLEHSLAAVKSVQPDEKSKKLMEAIEKDLKLRNAS